MAWFLVVLAISIAIGLQQARKRDAERAANAAAVADAEFRRQLDQLTARNQDLIAENLSLQVFKDVRDASMEATRLRDEANHALDAAKIEAQRIRQGAETASAEIKGEALAEVEVLRRDARANSADARRKAEVTIVDANERAARLVADAEARAEAIAGDAYRALRDADNLVQTATAMRNVIDGYGDLYLKPTYSLLDQLAEDYGFDEAGKALKLARANTQSMVNAGRASDCDYVERNRRETAIRFVLDAFNGKVDTILGRVKSDNYGTLEQQVRDAYALVNHNGSAFRNARITPEYLASRLDEVRWAASVMALKERDREEQRRIRDQMREEEKARREIERALREAEKEEEALQRAMAKVQEQVAKADEAQKANFQAQLDDLRNRLAEAEAKNQRALSMAQQTKAGHVYVISNVGSFGEQVFKVGMTRRLEPRDRVRELGDASVPFPFDIHAMIWADDAPALEYALHKKFMAAQVNKVNPRKEFFRIPLADLKQTVEEQGLVATWTISAEASQYRETLAIEKALVEQGTVAQEWMRSQMGVSRDELVPENEDA